MIKYRSGFTGALMDEYERAANELINILAPLSDEAYQRIRDTETEDEACRSIQTIMTHVIGAGYGYAIMYRQAWGMDHIERPRELVSKADVINKLNEALAYMCETLNDKWNISPEEADALQIHARWGPTYDFEQLFEHAIVHVMRHRRQIEKFLSQEQNHKDQNQ